MGHVPYQATGPTAGLVVHGPQLIQLPCGGHFLPVDGSMRFESENRVQFIREALRTRASGEVVSGFP